MHKYSSSPSLVPHFHYMLILKVISHTYITLEPQASLVAYDLVEFEVDLLKERVERLMNILELGRLLDIKKM